jgi:hypothetical protein
MKIAALIVVVVGLLAQLAVTAVAADTPRGRILDFENGYVVMSDGRSFRVAADLQVVDAVSGQPTQMKPAPGLFARLTLDAAGNVVQIALASTPKAAAPGPIPSQAVALPVPAAQPGRPQGVYAPVTFLVLVPSTTQPGDQVYLSTSESSWNPTAVRMDRLDGRHFRVIIEVPVGSAFLYLYTRGSPQSIERARNGLQRVARTLSLTSAAPQAQAETIAHWGDEVGTSILPPPQTFPTPYNPAPFPNLPTTSIP